MFHNKKSLVHFHSHCLLGWWDVHYAKKIPYLQKSRFYATIIITSKPTSGHQFLFCAWPIQYTPSHPIYSFILILFMSSFQVVSYLQAFGTKVLYALLSPHARYIPCLSHTNWSDEPNNVWWRVQIMALFIRQFSSASCHFILLRLKCSQHPVLEYSQFVFFP
jgi:hypothetical protein